MTRISKFLRVAVIFGAPISGVANALAISPVPMCQEATLAAPTITDVERSSRTDGLWHDVFVEYRGKASQKMTLSVFWDAQTVAEGGKGTVSSKTQNVTTDAEGQGKWKMEVKGYPAGKMRASVRDEGGQTSELSPVFDMPWIY